MSDCENKTFFGENLSSLIVLIVLLQYLVKL